MLSSLSRSHVHHETKIGRKRLALKVLVRAINIELVQHNRKLRVKTRVDPKVNEWLGSLVIDAHFHVSLDGQNLVRLHDKRKFVATRIWLALEAIHKLALMVEQNLVVVLALVFKALCADEAFYGRVQHRTTRVNLPLFGAADARVIATGTADYPRIVFCRMNALARVALLRLFKLQEGKSVKKKASKEEEGLKEISHLGLGRI